MCSYPLEEEGLACFFALPVLQKPRTFPLLPLTHSPASGPLLRREVLCVVCAANEDDFVLWAFWWGEARGAELLK